MPSKVLLVAFVTLGTLRVLIVASYGWMRAIARGADAVDIVLLLRSLFYWVMIATILFGAGWLLRRWLFLSQGR